MSNFYKVIDTEALNVIDDFFNKRDEFYATVKKICDHYGFNHHSSTDSIVFGIRFNNMCADPRSEVINKELWKTAKIKNSHMVSLLPRATAKEHKESILCLKHRSQYRLWQSKYLEVNTRRMARINKTKPH